MTRTLCVDPGLRGVGVAVFEGKVLERAAYIENPEKSGRGYRVASALAFKVHFWLDAHALTAPDKAIIEFPRIYPGHAKIDNNDLIDIATVGAAIATWCEADEIVSVFPADWKGNVKKDVMTARIKAELSYVELSKVDKSCRRSLLHNVYDAVGIGLHRFGRLSKKILPGASE